MSLLSDSLFNDLTLDKVSFIKPPSLHQLVPDEVRCFNVIQSVVTILFFVVDVHVLVGNRYVTLELVVGVNDLSTFLSNVLKYSNVGIAFARSCRDKQVAINKIADTFQLLVFVYFGNRVNYVLHISIPP